MKLTYLLDTNAVIYLQKGLLAAPLPEGVYGISIITEIELRSFSGLTPDQQTWLKRFFDSIYMVGLTEAIKEQVIQLRQRYRIKLPDAIIAATAIQEQAILLTNDRQLHTIDILNSAELLITPS